jgi:cytoskeletal protein CcmA (bactofilin family)
MKGQEFMRKKKRAIIDSFIGKDAAFEGRLSFSGTVRIDGEFRGDIDATGDLVVGSDGKIEGNIVTGSLVSSGEIRGTVVAAESLELRVPGKLIGDIQAPKVVIHEGVVFKGNCHMAPSGKADEKTGQGRGAKVLSINSEKGSDSIDTGSVAADAGEAAPITSVKEVSGDKAG